MSRRLFSGKSMTAGQALRRSRTVHREPKSPIDAEFKRQIDEGYRQFWARRGRDSDAFGFSGGFAG